MTAITPVLFLFTLSAVLLFAIGGYLLFIRKRTNRHPREKEALKGQTMVPTESEKPS